MFYKKELLENMSQGARLKFIRENKGIKLNDIAEYLGCSSNKPIREWKLNFKLMNNVSNILFFYVIITYQKGGLYGF